MTSSSPAKTRRIIIALSLAGSVWVSQAAAQAPVTPPLQSQSIGDIEHRLTDLTETLAQTQAALERSQAELARLRAQVNALRNQNVAAPPTDFPSSEAAASSSVTADTSIASQIQTLKEQQDILEAEVKQHEQSKLESASRYNLAVTGLALFNAYSNAGVVDNSDLPAFAFPRTPGASHGSLGATLRQTVLGVAATGPVLAGAQTYAMVNVDFFGGTNTNAYGYTSLDGYVRMRDVELGLDWKDSKLKLGYYGPLISPLSPTSIATVAQPALTGSGNLWTWSPQLQFLQNLPLRNARGLSFEGGLISAASPYYSSIQLDNPIEASRRPGVEGRIAYHADNSATASPRSLVFGVGAYTASQFYSSTTSIHSWAVTGDWQIPVSGRIDISGELYRGRALGGLGGGVYKDILYGTDTTTGQYRTLGVDTAGGWTQLKFTVNPHWESNAVFGLDNAFSSNFHSLILPDDATSLTLTARNSTVAGNLIFRPLSSLVFSPEYRRITTWRYTGAPYVANIFTLSAGYKF